MFSEFPISTSNLPKSLKMYHSQYWPNRQTDWPNRQPVLAKSPTGISQIANRYWLNHQPVLAKSPTSIDEFDNTSGVYKVPNNLISFPTPLFSNLISFPWPPYSGRSGGPPPWFFFENGLLNRAFLGHFSAFWLMAGWVRTLSEPAPEPPLKFWIEYSFFFLNKGNYFFVSSFFSIWDEIVNRRESKTSWCGRISKLWNGNGKM